jgi:hypothetical protein
VILYSTNGKQIVLPENVEGDLDVEELESWRCQDSVESKFPLEIKQGPNVGENSCFSTRLFP